MRHQVFRVAGNVTFGLLVVGVIAELGASIWLSHRHDSASAPVQVAAAETTTELDRSRPSLGHFSHSGGTLTWYIDSSGELVMTGIGALSAG